MKRGILKLMAVILVLALFSGTALAVSTQAVVSLRIEGMQENFYFNSKITVSLSETGTLRDVINSLSSISDVPKITVINEKEDSRITQIGALKEKSIGGPFDDGWMIRVNGKNVGKAPDVAEIRPGDEIVIYYGDPSIMQYPEIDLTRMITDGIVKITSADTTVDDKGNIYITQSPVAEALVTWDGMTYKTNANGEIIIDSTGAGIRHTIQIERFYANGMPTVLRLAPEYFVKYGYHDVPQGEWYFDSVMYITDRSLMGGVSETEFAPDMPMNRAMFVTVLGRLTEAPVDQTEESGFLDVKNDGWSTGYITWAAQNQIVSGYPGGTFGPYDNIMREQIAVILYNYARFQGYSTALVNQDMSVYTDYNKVSGYAVTATQWAVESGIIKGNAGRLDPKGLATRAQTATMLERFIEKYSN